MAQNKCVNLDFERFKKYWWETVHPVLEAERIAEQEHLDRIASGEEPFFRKVDMKSLLKPIDGGQK